MPNLTDRPPIQNIKPTPKTFYYNRTMGGLYYFLGKDGKDYIFDAVMDQRRMRQASFARNLVEVENLESYIQRNPQDTSLVVRHTQNQNSGVENAVERGKEILAELDDWGNPKNETFRVRQERRLRTVPGKCSPTQDF